LRRPPATGEPSPFEPSASGWAVTISRPYCATARNDPLQGVAILDVAPAPDKSDPVIETTFPIADPPAAMLAVAQTVPGGPGNILAERLRSPVVTLRTLLEGARADWGGQPGTILALTPPPAEDVYLRGEPPYPPAPTAATVSAAPESIEPSDVEGQMSLPERRRVQARLQALGYYQGNVDAVFGPVTRDAIRRYQEAKGLPQTGRLGVGEATQLLFFEAPQATP
jgi:Putative peptidoglycan binding domain